MYSRPTTTSASLFDLPNVIIDRNKFKEITKIVDETFQSGTQVQSNLDGTSLDEKTLVILREEFRRLQADLINSQNHFKNQNAALIQQVDKFLASPLPSSHSQNKAPQPPPQQPIQPISTAQKVNPSRSEHRRHKTSGPMSDEAPRPQERIISMMSSNPLDVWNISDIFFKPIPSDEEIQAFFQKLNLPIDVTPTHNPQHWSFEFNRIAAEASKESRRGTTFLLAPGPKPSSSSLSDYWVANPPTFPIEDIQKQNKGVFHCLLNAFVEASAEEKPQSYSKKEQFLKSHPLLPVIQYSGYISHPFEDRLQYELMSLELNPPAEQDTYADVPFMDEILSFKEKIEKQLIGDLNAFKEAIMIKSEEIHLDQKKRDDDLRIFQIQASNRELQTKKRKR